MSAELAHMPAGDPLVNVEAEAELLGSLMQDNAYIDRAAEIVSAGDFAEPVMGRIFSAIVRECSLGRPANPIMLKGYFENDEGLAKLGGPGFLARLTANASGLAAMETAKQIAELALRRRMRAGLVEASRDCANLDTSVADIVTAADEAVTTFGRDTIQQPTGGECIDDLLASYRENTAGITCAQVPSVDDLLGPIKPKQLVIGAGRPGMGKTAFALSYGIGAARNGHGVLFVSLEMSARELAARMVGDLCYRDGEGVQFSAIRDGTLNDWQARRVDEAAQIMHELPFRVIDAGSLTIGRLNMLIRRNARRMAAQGHTLELVIVDYLQLLSPDTRLRSNYEAVSEVSRSLKAMAKDHGVAVLALAQLSREVEKRHDRRPQLSDLRDSGQIEQDADAVLFLTRQEYYERLNEPEAGSAEWDDWNRLLHKMAGEIEFICAKRRNGTTGNAKGRFLGAYQAVRG